MIWIHKNVQWLKWSKLGLCLPLQTEESVVGSSEQTLQNTLEKLLQRQEEMEANFTRYLRKELGTAGKDKKLSSKQCTKKRKVIDKTKEQNILTKKWLAFNM